MTITYTIPGATLLDQLDPTTLDGLANNDANDNCVGTSVAEGLHIETGKTFDGDEVKDQVYGAGYVGTESAAHYVSYCADQRVSLTPHNDTQAGLVSFIHSAVSAGHPVILTMPSDWATPEADPLHPSASTHVGIAVGVGPGEIRVMNPWHGFMQDASDAWWQPRLCYGQVWAMQKASATMVPAGWSDDGVTLHDPAGHAITMGFRTMVLNWPGGWEPWNEALTASDDDLASVEFANASIGKGTRRVFRARALGWSPTFNSGQPYVIWVGHELLAREAEVASVQQQLTSAQANVTAMQQQRDALSAQLSAAQQTIQQLQAQIQQLQNQQPSQQTQAALLFVKAFQTLETAMAAQSGNSSAS